MKIIHISTAVLAAALLFSACKKDKKDTADPTPSLIGSWKISQFGQDLNNNNVADANELGSFAGTGFARTLTFNSNNTFTDVGTFAGAIEVKSGAYFYDNRTISTTFNNTTEVVVVNKLTATQLITKRANTTPVEWTVFTR